MELQRIALENSALDEELLRVSDSSNLENLRDSLRRSGQLNPLVVLLRQRGDAVLVSGFRRLQALRDLRSGPALAWVYESAEITLTEAFQAALAENLSHRALNPLEKARSISILSSVCGMSQEELIGRVLPILGLPAHKNVVRSYIHLDGLSARLKSFFLDGRLTLATAERLGSYPEPDRETMQQFFEQARWSASLQRRLLSLIEDLAGANGCGIGDIAARASCEAILEDTRLSGFEKGEKIYERLYRISNPRLSAAESAFKEEKEKLGLPGSIRLAPDPYFETTKLRVEFDAANADAFKLAASHLARAAQHPALPKLFRLE
jgi:hypothetical protein